MQASYRNLRLRLSDAGLWPTSKVAVTAWYLLALDLLLALVRTASSALGLRFGDSLGGWVIFLGLVVILLFQILAYRWIKQKLLWRLRNRLIVTYVFIGVIPVVLLVALALGSFYLFAGQFATFIVTSELNSELKSLEASNAALTHQLVAQMDGNPMPAEAIKFLRESEKKWPSRKTCVWLNHKLVLDTASAEPGSAPPTLPERLTGSFRALTREHDELYLRAVEHITTGNGSLTVVSSEPFDQRLLQELAVNLGEISLYGSGLSLHEVHPSQGSKAGEPSNSPPSRGTLAQKPDSIVLDTGNGPLRPTLTAGNIPPPTRQLDHTLTFATTVSVEDWETGDTKHPVGLSVQTRFSKLYEHLFSALGDLAPAVEFGLLFFAVLFALIEAVALFIGTRLTRTVTGAVAQLYDATTHVNRGDFSHRIPVKSNDQIATLANSFNSMTASIEKLIEEQKEKQRMENELAIAQEVQAQLFPHEISQLASLEVHGFCRPARTVSGDYYDFLCLDSSKLILAVGDISGKGISAALLMATIHSAVRAYSLERSPALQEPATVGVAARSGVMLAARLPVPDISPAALLAMLNHQLYESTPAEKYATLFLGIYDGTTRKINYTNGGHLPPIVMSDDGSVQRLEAGGTVVGLFDRQHYDEGSIQLHAGDILVAYSDGVTEPENDFGEFGEQRLIDLIRENRTLPLPRISEIVAAAVDDWIGANEQPDDVTLVLARAR
jgi:sigma-B regulation protein RsbU (phosphoserine phosphatase)